MITQVFYHLASLLSHSQLLGHPVGQKEEEKQMDDEENYDSQALEINNNECKECTFKDKCVPCIILDC